MGKTSHRGRPGRPAPSTRSGPPFAAPRAERSAWMTAAAAGLVAGLGLAFADRVRGRITAPDGAAGTPVFASSPRKIPAATWKHILVRTWVDFNRDQITSVAGGVTFFSLLALFPALSAFVSLYGLVANVQKARQQVDDLQGLMPAGAVSVLSDQITRLSQMSHAHLGVAFAVSLLVSVWSSNAGVKALFYGLNVAYEATETRNFFVLNLTSLAFTLGMTVFMLVAVGSIAAAPGLLSALGYGGLAGISLLRWPALLILVTILLSVLYRYGPSRPHARWRSISPGGAATAAAWIIMSLGFSWYASHFGSYDRTYGSLGAIVGFMTWIWLSIIVVLFGAELNSEIEKHVRTGGAGSPPLAGGGPDLRPKP